ncbi:MAG: hypothetical protein HRU82_03350 [Nitrospira sp.]|nr:MAG: hypothetical protein HRU82_03350 [Nitrospira sp.]
MKVRFAVLADYANVTQEGKLNVLGMFEKIHVSKFPVKLPAMQLIIRFEADISERNQQKSVQVRLINGRGERVLELGGSIAIGNQNPDNLPYLNQLLTLRDLVFPDAGDYQFDIYIDGSLAHSVPLKVVRLNSNPQA